MGRKFQEIKQYGAIALLCIFSLLHIALVIGLTYLAISTTQSWWNVQGDISESFWIMGAALAVVGWGCLIYVYWGYIIKPTLAATAKLPKD